jgi:hypothetical protein
VARPDTEQAWVDVAIGKNLRQIEQLVAGRKPGDRPDTPPRPEIKPVRFALELSPETYALFREARASLQSEHGGSLDDDAFVRALCLAALSPSPAGEPDARAPYQIAITVCERCDQAWQDGAGRTFPIGAAALAQARCFAQDIGSIAGDEPGRATQTIPPAMVRLVWRRDHGRCRVPGCRSARNLEIHHLQHREDGGGHDASNLVLACGSCHAAHHRGDLEFRGTSSALEVIRPGQSLEPEGDPVPRGTEGDPVPQAPRGTSERWNAATRRARLDRLSADARQALVGLGFRPGVAGAAVAFAVGRLGGEPELTTLIAEALRSCNTARKIEYRGPPDH